MYAQFFLVFLSTFFVSGQLYCSDMSEKKHKELSQQQIDIVKQLSLNIKSLEEQLANNRITHENYLYSMTILAKMFKEDFDLTSQKNTFNKGFFDDAIL